MCPPINPGKWHRKFGGEFLFSGAISLLLPGIAIAIYRGLGGVLCHMPVGASFSGNTLRAQASFTLCSLGGGFLHGLILLGVFMNNSTMFIILGIMVGCFQGGIQALSRGLYSNLIPTDKSAEFYGFFNILGKFAAIIEPFLMGAVAVWAEPLAGAEAFRYGILAIIILFIVGGLILTRVDVEAGTRMAKEGLTGSLEKREDAPPNA